MARPNTLYYHSSIWQLDYRLGMSVKIYGKRTQVLHNEHSSYYRQHTHNNTEKRKKKKGNYIYYINVKKGRKIQVTVKTAVTPLTYQDWQGEQAYIEKEVQRTEIISKLRVHA